MLAIKAKKIFTGSSFIHHGVIIWYNDRIIAIGNEKILSQYTCRNIEYTDHIIVPGFIDIQVNGAGGANFYGEEITLETLLVMSKTLRKFGCTSFCPTLTSSNDDDIHRSLDLVNSCSQLDDMGVLGLHLEGPMFAQEFRGAHNKGFIRILTQELINKISHSKVKIVSLAPEVTPHQYITQLTQAGIKVSMAHTGANFEQIRTAESYGATMGTHLYNAMSRFNSREPNTVGALLTSKTTFTSIIPDGNHCAFDSVILAHQCLGDRLIAITDGLFAMGTNTTNFNLGAQQVTIDKNKRCIGNSGELVGSIITPIECLQNLIHFCEFSLEEALIALTKAPAEALALSNKIGILKPNNYANFIILDEKELRIQDVYFKGTK